MEFGQYSTYTIQDFLEDDQFIAFIIAPDEERTIFWKNFTDKYPSKKPIVDQAAALVAAYREQDVFTNAGNQQAIWQRIESSIQNQPQPLKKVVWLNTWLRVAAMLLLVSSIGFTLWVLTANSKQNISTAYGELRTVTLPDNSVVVLNGNTKLTYAKNWVDGPREVWITGEGFFKVKHLNQDQLHIKSSERFIVHCNDVNIEVLGTSFNVRNRHSKTNIGLVSGKIRLDYTDSLNGHSKSLVMKPGDYVAYGKKGVLAQSKLAEPIKLTEWTLRQLNFNNATLADIAGVLTDDYGYQVSFADPRMQDLKIEGEISVPSVTELVDAISTTLHVKIKQTNKSITISNP
ncbi:hypothetical protein A0256_18230 [Mucilaginibacter sp. PAMC 26640]|nr:hypothetical protein A0256_18230 [Mucilaginibacter sp. PAMC 26640]